MPNAAHSPWEQQPLPNTPFTLRYIDPAALGDDDATAIVDMLGRAFNGGPSWFSYADQPSDHLRWKSADCPYESVIEVSEDGHRVIGLLVCFLQRYLLEGRPVAVSTSTDASLDPAYQRMGVSSERRAFRDQILPLGPGDLTVAFGMHPLSRTRRNPQTGRRDTAHQVHGLARLVNPRSLFQRGERGDFDATGGASQTRAVLEGQRRGRFSRETLGRLILGGRMALAAARPRFPRRSDWTIETTHRFEANADAFWEEAATQFDLIQVRDRDFLNWRFCDPNAGAFTVRTITEDGRLLGYSALRLDARETVIADLLALPGRTDVAHALVNDALAQARASRSAMARAWMLENHPYDAVLRGLGFVRYPLATQLGVTARDLASSDLDFITGREARIHFMTADTDHV